MKKALLFLSFGFALFTAKAQTTVDDVINKHITALGGKEKLLTLKTLKREGALNYSGMDIPLTLFVEQSAGYRMNISAMGMDGYKIITPTAGWSYMPFQGNSSVEEMTADQVKDAQDNLDIQGELLDYATKGHKAELVGEDKMDGVAVYNIKFTEKNGMVKNYYIDTHTYYINKVTATTKEGTSEVTYSNYKKTEEGFVQAYTLVRAEGEVNFSKITANSTLPADTFKPAK